MTVTIDHEGFPHIVELILSHASLGTRAAFSATCKKHREDMKDTLRLVRLRYGGNAAVPGFADSSNSPVPCIPTMVSVIDLSGYFWNYSGRKRVRRAFNCTFSRLAVIRRIPPTEEPSQNPGNRSHVRLRNVPTLVDYIDLDRLPEWWSKKPELVLHACLNRHILHLRWPDDGVPKFPGLRFMLASSSLERVIVLWPRRLGPVTTPRPGLTWFLHATVRNGAKRWTIVGPESLKQFSPDHCRYISHETWWEELGSQKADVGEWVED
ncbi:uncharacterized protein LOC62_04G005296 [Vanrija pseudolonga]|uniref:Uncharacterized protein n=1 Tax=Vanrija pseudolonga TaxID=143232 RepID=A0AAF0Y817_9TREE|nr:hypothetical protein LOC62_04G005296 [Vanrija pseudolonga]